MAAPGWVPDALERVRAGRARTAIVGCGYVGLNLAVETARAGSPVVGIDVNEALTKELNAGTNPVPDVYIPDGELAALRDAGKLSFATAFEGPADVYVICVHTPLRDGSPDLRYVESAGESVAKVLTKGALVVLESTTYPGTTEELLQPILEEATGLKAGEDFSIAHSPERINPGDRNWGLHNTPKVVGGLTPWCTELACTFYDRVAHSVVPVSSPRAAEITKLFENSHRLVNIALANEMAVVCHDFNIDPWEVLKAASTKPFGFTPFRPGPGVGGECLPEGERIFVRIDNEMRFATVEEAFESAAREESFSDVGEAAAMRRFLLHPERLEVAVLADGDTRWNSVTIANRRPYEGMIVTFTTQDGRGLSVTENHPMLVWFGEGVVQRLAKDVTGGDVFPVWLGPPVPVERVERTSYNGYVYSFETEPSHTLTVTNGIVVHNCIPTDPQYLAWRVRGKFGRQFRMLEAASDINDRMPVHVAQRAAEILNETEKAMRGARILLLGVAFKGSSAVTRESPALRVADRLATSGAELTYHDPFVPDATFNGVVYESQELTDELVKAADLVIILTDHPDIDYAHIVDIAACTYDTRGVTETFDLSSGRLYRA